jgi:hypothetical protein
MSFKNDQTELETKIIRYRALARLTADDLTQSRMTVLLAEMEQELREMEENALGQI